MHWPQNVGYADAPRNVPNFMNKGAYKPMGKVSRHRRRWSEGATTLADVARVAEVSLMTASRVVNDRAGVGATTRERVNRAIKSLNYVPNHAASALAVARNMRVTVVYANPSSSYLSALLLGVLAGAEHASIQVVIDRWHPKDATATKTEMQLLRTVGGVIVPPPLCGDLVVMRRLARTGKPTIAVARATKAQNFSTLRIDNYAGSYELTSFLLQLGHTRIGYIKGNPNQLASELRFDGYKAAIHDAHVRMDRSIVKQGYFTYKSGRLAAEKLLGVSSPPTAIIAANDDMAVAAISVAHRLGLRVPTDLSVAGFDDSPIAETAWPTLTTVRQPIYDMGSTAVTLIAAAIRGGDKSHNAVVDRVMPHKMIIRESTSKPPPRR